jgi:hypothetical protein
MIIAKLQKIDLIPPLMAEVDFRGMYSMHIIMDVLITEALSVEIFSTIEDMSTASEVCKIPIQQKLGMDIPLKPEIVHEEYYTQERYEDKSYYQLYFKPFKNDKAFRGKRHPCSFKNNKIFSLDETKELVVPTILRKLKLCRIYPNRVHIPSRINYRAVRYRLRDAFWKAQLAVEEKYGVGSQLNIYDYIYHESNFKPLADKFVWILKEIPYKRSR